MSSTFLVPGKESNYEKTLYDPISLSDWTDRPDDFPNRARVWGVRTDPEMGTWERNRQNWNRMERGDRLLFYRNGEGSYFATGTVGAMGTGEFVREQFWNGGPAITVYEVQDYDDSIDMTSERVNALLGYKEGFHPQGIRRVADSRPSDRLFD